MSLPTPTYASLDEWIAREAIPFSVDSPKIFKAVVGRYGDGFTWRYGGIAGVRRSAPWRGGHSHPPQPALPAPGGGARLPRHRHREQFSPSTLRERVCSRHGSASYEAVQDLGFSHGFGRLDANRELVEWMRQYNTDLPHHDKLHFYGFDSPTEMTSTDSPRQVQQLVLDYLTSIDRNSGQAYRRRIEPLLGQDAGWENPAAMLDPTKSIGRARLLPHCGSRRRISFQSCRYAVLNWWRRVIKVAMGKPRRMPRWRGSY